MGINPLIDKAGSQEQAVANSQSAIQAEMDRALKNKETDKKSTDRSTAQKMAESKSTDELAKGLLSNLASKLLNSGVNLKEALSNKMDRNLKDEHDLMLDHEKEDSNDMVSLSKKYKATKKQRAKQFNQRMAQESSGKKDTSGAKEYSKLYSQFVLHGGKELKKKMQLLEQQMLRDGATLKSLQTLQKNILSSMRAEIAGQIKEKYLMRLLSKENSLDWASGNIGLKDILGFAQSSHKLGGWDFGGKTLQQVTDDKVAEAKSEVKDFVKEELEMKMVRNKINKDVSEKEFKELLELGGKVGFDADKFVEEWDIKMIDMGISPFSPPEAGSNNAGGQQQKQPDFEFDQDDQKEGLINQLRAVYMQRAVGGMRAELKTFFKMMKLKNGLIKLGVQLGDFDRIEKEGIKVAKQKCLEMLEEAFQERATLYDLKGTANELVKKKIKSVNNNLKRLGVSLSKAQINAMIDKANQEMFESTRVELEHLEALMQKDPNPKHEKTQAFLVKLLQRLQQESNLAPGYDPAKNLKNVKSKA